MTMATLKELSALAKDYGLPGRSKLKKDDLIKAIAEVHAAEFIKILQRAQKTGRHSALLGDVEDPHKKDRRGRELGQVMDEVDAALRAKRYISAVEKKPLLRQQPLKRITDRLQKARGLTRSKVETLARAIKREAPKILENFLDPGAYYDLVVDNVPVLFPDGSYAKKGDTIVREEIREDVGGRSYKLRPVARGPDITGDGEVYWASFENEDLRVTKAMGELVLELLNPDEQYKLFTVVGKAAKEPLAPITEEEGVSEHRIKGKTIVRGDQVSAGSLHGIDQHMWEKGREYLVFVRYELRPLPEQNGEPGPMLAPEEDGEFANCFVRYVVDHFRNKMTRAGSGLTPKRRRIFEQFDNRLVDTGCTKEDMFALETALKVKLVTVDALGSTLWDSGLYNTSTTVVVPCHNNHAWADIPIDPPKVQRVHFLDEPAEQALSAVVASEGHEAKTTAAQETLDKNTREILVAFAARAIPSTTRLWLCGQFLVGSDGSLWRSRSAALAIDKAFEAETCANPQDDLPKELEEEYHKATLGCPGRGHGVEQQRRYGWDG